MAKPRWSALWLVCLWAGWAPVRAAQFSVDSTSDQPDALAGDGLCATATGTCTLRAAVDEANATAAADEVLLPAGTFPLTLSAGAEDLNLGGDLDVRAPLALRGAGATSTVIDGQALDRVLDVHAPGGANTLALTALALAHGRIDGTQTGPVGVGLRVPAGVQVALLDVDIRDNAAPSAFGGAIGLDNAGCVSGQRVRLLRNRDPGPTSFRALAGAAVTRGAGSCFELVDSEISDNTGDQVGGLYVIGGASLTLRRSLVSGNRARQVGGFLNNIGGVVLLEDVTVSGNRGASGAASNDGGTQFRLHNCTVTGNGPVSGVGLVGGIGDVHGGFGMTFLRNTVIAGNGPGSIANDCDRLRLEGGNVIGTAQGCNFALTATDRANLDPQLGALADLGGFSRAHAPGSPLRDKGLDSACSSRDQRGVQRPQDGDGDGQPHCDVGAIEAQDAGTAFADGFE